MPNLKWYKKNGTKKYTHSTRKHQQESFVTKYIFPGGQIPMREWVAETAEDSGLHLVHVEVFGGQHYGKTLKEWNKNMHANESKIKELGYDASLIRKYEFYFSECEACFMAGRTDLTHFVFQKTKSLRDSNTTAFCRAS